MAGLLAAPKRRRPQFHRLTVSRIDRLTDDAVAISLAIPPDLTDTFSFAAGQYLTLRADLDGQQVRRSYSICLSPAAAARRAELRVAAARVERGVMSTWLNERVRVGDDIDVLPPMGEFVIAPAPPGAPGRHHVAIAAGSGITPVLSLLMAALEAGDDATLIFGNRRESSIMFADELAELARDNPDSLRVIHVFSRKPVRTHCCPGVWTPAGSARSSRSVCPREMGATSGTSVGPPGSSTPPERPSPTSRWRPNECTRRSFTSTGRRRSRRAGDQRPPRWRACQQVVEAG